MCGIAGIAGRFGSAEVSAALQPMINAQIHRGPDDSGMEVFQVGEATVGLGCRRLAIVDLSPFGHQPMVESETGDVLTYNGEIYNSPQLRGELEDSGVSFRGRSDTEVLLRAYQRWGLGCLDRLRGMFAFSLWDNRNRRLLLARDHLGIKPLYYASIPGKGLVWASEVRALTASGLVPATLDRRALAGYLAYGAVQEPLTVLEGVRAAPPSSWMSVDASGNILERGIYWRLPDPDNSLAGNEDDLVEEGRSLLSQAVRRHLISDVPLGVFLSSGLDSTAVLGLARKVSTGDLHAFTVSFPEQPAQDEGPVARETADRLHVTYHQCDVESSTALEWVRDGLDCMDQPTMDGLNTYMISRAVREQGIVVALSGQGGDEMFGGYSSFRQVPRWFRWMKRLRAMRPEWRAALVGLAASRMSSVAREKANDIAVTGPDLPALCFQYRRLFSNRALAAFGLNPAELGLSDSFHPEPLDVDNHVAPNDPIASVGRFETVFYQGNMLLRDGDVFGMANSLELRVPFLDRDLVEWAYRLNGKALVSNGSPNKPLLRRICADFYSQSQAQLPKRGFSPPFGLWLLNPLRDVMEECLTTVKGSGLLMSEGVDRVRSVFLNEPRSAAWSRVWALVALGHWVDTHKAN